MTLYFEITLWGGLPPPIKKDIEAVRTLQVAPSMAEGAPVETFFAQLSACHTTRHLYSEICAHHYATRPSHGVLHSAPANAVRPRHYFNPSEYRIKEIVVLKRRLFIQHEGFVFRVRHEPPASAQHLHPAGEPDFFISIDRNINATHSNSFFSSPKFAIDLVQVDSSPPSSMVRLGLEQIKGTFCRPVVWRMPTPGHTYVFNLNLSQVGVLLDAVSFSYPQQQYNPLYKNCFSHTRILRAVIIKIIQEQQPNNVVAADEPNEFGVTLGTCFGFRWDRDQGEEGVVFENYQNLYTQFLS